MLADQEVQRERTQLRPVRHRRPGHPAGPGGFRPGIASSVDGDNDEFREFRDTFRSRSATFAVSFAISLACVATVARNSAINSACARTRAINPSLPAIPSLG
ncbi:hypothetical protein Manayef4_19070 [Frankia sp. CgMI4]|nr:hypothetical protein Manayef4_19070 [Frankia sp. CgIM4]